MSSFNSPLCSSVCMVIGLFLKQLALIKFIKQMNPMTRKCVSKLVTQASFRAVGQHLKNSKSRDRCMYLIDSFLTCPVQKLFRHLFGRCIFVTPPMFVLQHLYPLSFWNPDRAKILYPQWIHMTHISYTHLKKTLRGYGYSGRLSHHRPIRNMAAAN